MKKYKVELINAFIKQHNISEEEFCKFCGISKAMLERIKKNDETIKVNYLYQVTRVLQVKLEDFIK